ncbi:hypothetical protein [Bacillus litorisediminis]|uniref:hypothetical protein n=1 Tax=Bacillus litorisediminis TaxID=2922713 RepID=UPI001FACC8F1|nr:hypothetical protein [Bacillus litorisediminis]
MKQYFVNKMAADNGDHEVHAEGCVNPPTEENRDYLGSFSNCEEAVKKAKQKYDKVDGCFHCCKECHTT